MRPYHRLNFVFLMFALGCLLAAVAPAAESYIGGWALTIPGGGAGWLGIEKDGAGYKGSLLWGGGSVLPVATVAVEGDSLIVTRIREIKKPDASGKMKSEKITDTIRAKANGDELALTIETPRPKGEPQKAEFTGKRLPPMPPKPDLARVKFGETVSLFNGKDLTGWRLVDPKAENGWSVQDGVLINRPVKEKGRHFGNLRTDREFEDFNLKLEVSVPKDGNSGVYLRGIYEVQIADSFGKPAESHGMGSVYSRITPTSNPAKAPGEWQALDITLVDRHVTVVLNGVTIIDNQPVPGCTGGALWSDPFRPGPLYLQGDHLAVDFRNIVLRPVAK